MINLFSGCPWSTCVGVALGQPVGVALGQPAGVALIIIKESILEEQEKKLIALNRKARHDYFVDETYEAGIVLSGTEVKSIRQGSINFKDSYCEIDNLEMFIHHMHISPYEKGNIFNRDPLRVRKLLMHKREISRLFDVVRKKGMTLIPLSLYFKGSKVKIEIGLCRGKKLYDKRDTAAEMSAKREMERAMKLGNRA